MNLVNFPEYEYQSTCSNAHYNDDWEHQCVEGGIRITPSAKDWGKS